MRSKQPQPLPDRLAPYDEEVPGIKPSQPFPPPPPPTKEEHIMVEKITIAETINGFIVTIPNSFGGRDTMTFEQRDSDGCVVNALINALHSVIEGLSCQGTKHDICRIKVSCQNEENEDD